jgi:hypothetical protein
MKVEKKAKDGANALSGAIHFLPSNIFGVQLTG